MEEKKDAKEVKASTASEPTEVKKKSKAIYFVIGCVVLLLCCAVAAGVVWFAAPGLLVKFIGQGNTKDTTLTTIANSEVESTFNKLIDKVALEDPTRPFTVEMTEKEFLASMLNSSTVLNADGVGLDFEPGSMKVQFALAQLFSSVDESQLPKGFDKSTIKDLYLNMECTTSADGKTIVLKSINTGNPILDVFLGSEDFKKEFQDGFNEGISNDNTYGLTITKIEFKKDLLAITYSPSLD